MFRTVPAAALLLLPLSARCQTSFSGDISSAFATAASAPAGSARTLARRFNDQFNVLDYGAKCDGATDDTASFQRAEEAARFSPAGGGTVYVPSGSCRLTQTVYTNARAVWDLAAGVNLSGGGLLVGSTDMTANFGTSGRSVMAVGRDAGISNALFASLVSTATTGGSYQKNGLYGRVLQNDVSTASVPKDVVGVYGHGDIGPGNPNGRAWGGNFTATMPGGSSGYAVGAELSVTNLTGKTAAFGTLGSSIGLNVFASGNAPVSTGIYVGNAGQPFLNGILMYDQVATQDAFSLHRSDGSDSALAAISHTGAATFQSLQLAPGAVGSVVKYALEGTTKLGVSSALSTDGKSFTAANCPYLPLNTAASATILLVGRQPATGQAASWSLTGGLFAATAVNGAIAYQGPGAAGAAPLFVTGKSAATASISVSYNAASGCIMVVPKSIDGSSWDWKGSIELTVVQ